MEQEITYCGAPAKVACDEKCEKAWGISNRPKNQLSPDPDNYEFLSDDELWFAPIDPGTYEGGQAKPIDKIGIPNKWCVRECERCVMSELGKHNDPIQLPDFSKRIQNINQ